MSSDYPNEEAYLAAKRANELGYIRPPKRRKPVPRFEHLPNWHKKAKHIRAERRKGLL